LISTGRSPIPFIKVSGYGTTKESGETYKFFNEPFELISLFTGSEDNNKL
jgi:hypothetical protein